jgi:beta-mannosidase
MHNTVRHAALFICAFILGGFFSASAQSITTELDSNWRFRKTGTAEWMPATVPGTVHTDLFMNHQIPDPFFGDNENRLQWIDTGDWEYELWFNVNDSAIQNNHCMLSFEGLDTYAKVFLNDALLFSADNMFRTWEVDCKKFLKPKQNRLLIRFESASKKEKEKSKKLSYTLPGDERVFTRKAQYQYGWDWAPRFVTCGIWRPVKFILWNDIRIQDVQVITKELNDSVAKAEVRVNVKVDKPTTVYFKVIVEKSRRDSFYFERLMHSEDTIAHLSLQIKNPERWFCNGSGKAARYRFTIEARDPLSPTEKKSLMVGLRTVQLVQAPDSKGKSFYFKVNDIPVFMKGANWIPADHFLPRVTPEKYRTLLLAARDANMNMLRVWGGGVYEDDKFYDLCDSLGMMVWQDFMFACAMYPGDAEFLDNVKNEVKDNVQRLRNHPCIALWCGNNEIDEGWKNWGWQKQYHYEARDSAVIWNNYRKLFHEMIPAELSRLDSSRSYWESSPSIGWGHAESLAEGDSHYWGVWWGMEPFEKYSKKTGRFVSEYGFQGMPSSKAIETFTLPQDRTLKSAAIKNHQKHKTGFETIDQYMNGWFRKPTDFEGYRYISQLLQAEGLRTAIEAHRRAKPYCMGSLYWQLNDCWPVTSWSSIDYTGAWKASHYAVKESFQNYLISVDDTGKYLSVYIIKEDTGFRKATLMITVEDFSGSVLRRDSAFTYLSSDRATLVYKTEMENFPVLYNLSRTFIRLELRDHSQVITSRNYFFKKPKDLLLDKVQVQYTVKQELDHVSISLTGTTLAKYVFLEVQGEEIHFSENFFDLAAHEIKTVTVQTNLPALEIEKKLQVRTLSDPY